MAKQKTITPISNVRVALIGEVGKGNLQETVCVYKFKGQDVNRFIFVERKPGESEASCINKSKKELMRLHKTGALEAYSNKYIKGVVAGGVGLTRKGIAILASASVVAAGALITGGIFIGKALINNPYRPTVTFNALREGAHFGDNPALTKVSINVDKGAKVGDFIDSVNIPTLNYNDFKAWTLDGYEIERDYVIDRDTTLDASYAAQKTTIYLEAGGDGYGSLTPLTATKAEELNINDTINVVSFTVDKGTTIGEALAKDGQWRFKPGIHLTKETAPEYEVLGWSLDGGATYIDPTDPDEALLQKTLDEEKYTFIAGYDLKGSEITEFTDYNPSTWSQVVFNADSSRAATDKTKQTGQWDYNYSGANSNVQTLGLMINPTKIPTLGELCDLDIAHTWYANPIGDYAGFDYWYDSHVLERTRLGDDTEFVAGEALNLSAQYNPHFVDDDIHEQDPWRAIVNNANLGLDNLHYVYESDLVNNSLVGLKRDAELTPWNEASNDNVAEVRVIGEAQDYAAAILKGSGSAASSSSGAGVEKASDYVYSRPVALTFEFSIIPVTFDNNMEYRTPYGVESSYVDSQIYEYSERFVEALPNELKDNLRTVKKFVSISATSNYLYDLIDCKSFDLSPTECFKNPSGPLQHEILVEGVSNTYQYYATSDNDEIVPLDANRLRWLRSPKYGPSYREAYAVDSNGQFNSFGFSGDYDIFPSFCLGRK